MGFVTSPGGAGYLPSTHHLQESPSPSRRGSERCVLFLVEFWRGFSGEKGECTKKHHEFLLANKTDFLGF